MMKMPPIEEISRRRVDRMIEAYLRGKRGCSLNWIRGQLTKAHRVEEAAGVIKSREGSFRTMDSAKLDALLAALGL